MCRVLKGIATEVATATAICKEPLGRLQLHTAAPNRTGYTAEQTKTCEERTYEEIESTIGIYIITLSDIKHSMYLLQFTHVQEMDHHMKSDTTDYDEHLLSNNI